MTDVFKDTTSYSLFFELVDSTTGLPKTGIVYTDVTGSYVRTRSVRVPISMATLTGPADGFSAGGFILIDDTNQPGIYRLDVPAGAFATGAFEVVISVKATGCRTVSRQINLVNINNQVAYVPNAAADAAGGLPISDAGGLDLDAILADTGADGVVLSAATCAKIADVVRRRTQANVELSSYGDALSLGSEYGLIQQAQESNAVDTPGTLTIYKTDGSTVLGTKTLDTDAAADPVVGVS